MAFNRFGDSVRDWIVLPVGMTLRVALEEAVLQTLAATRGNKSKAAALLGIHRQTFYDLLDSATERMRLERLDDSHR
jgi:DNA-binding NtrC family response regulator